MYIQGTYLIYSNVSSAVAFLQAAKSWHTEVKHQDVLQ